MIACLTGTHKSITFKVHGVIQGRRVISLIDNGATHNFIDAQVVVKRGLQTDEHDGFKVMVASGHKLLCTQKNSNLHMRIGDYKLVDDFYVVDMGDYDVILGMTWMTSLVEFTFNLERVEMRFEHQGRKVVLRGLLDVCLRTVSLKQMERLIRHDQVQWGAEILVMPEGTRQQKQDYPPQVQSLLTKTL